MSLMNCWESIRDKTENKEIDFEIFYLLLSEFQKINSYQKKRNVEKIIKKYCLVNELLWFDLFVNNQIFKIEYRYECNDVSCSEKISEAKCDLCGEKVNEHDEFEIFVRLTKNIEEYLKEYNRNLLFSNINKKYLPTLKDIKKNLSDVVFFIGAGVSIPLGFPNWVNLFKKLEEGLVEESDKKKFKEYLDYGDVFKMIELIKRESSLYRKDVDIKKYVQDELKKNKVNDCDNLTNYKSIFEVSRNFIVTTNYDHALEWRNNKDDFGYRDLISFNRISGTTEFLKELSIFHIHGELDSIDSMIVTESDYINFYRNKKNLDKLTSIFSGKRIVFIGFSFKDKYFKDLFGELNEIFKENSYIITNNLHSMDIDDLVEENLREINIECDFDKIVETNELIFKYLKSELII